MHSAALNSCDTAPGLTGFSQCEDGLILRWSDGHESLFHFVWLRDCCYCEECGDSYSSKRFVLPSDIPPDVNPKQVEITPQGELGLVWEHDGHPSRYRSDWLRRHCYDDASRARRFLRPILWKAELVDRLPRVEFDVATRDEHHLLDLYRKLRDYGFVVVEGGPAASGGVEAVANLIGDLGESAYTRIFDLSPSSSVKTMGNTHKAVPPHTDEAFRYSPPGINLLGCVRPACDGGDTVLIDGFQVAAQLRHEDEAAFELLCRYGQSFNRIHPGELDQRTRQAMIVRDDRDEVIGIRFHTRSAGPLDLPATRVRHYYAAHRKFCELMMSEKHQIRFQLQSGDCVAFDNHRVLHSRTAFSDPERFLQICNVDRETFHERLRLLAQKLGHEVEADQVLPAGLS